MSRPKNPDQSVGGRPVELIVAPLAQPTILAPFSGNVALPEPAQTMSEPTSARIKFLSPKLYEDSLRALAGDSSGNSVPHGHEAEG
jgi:hypothetical protein